MESVTVGSDLIFVFERRAEGPAVHLLVRFPANPPQTETRQFRQVWRGDCFKDRPHEHFFGPDGEKQSFLSGEQAQHSLDWCLRRMLGVKRILVEAGYPDVSVDMFGVHDSLLSLAASLKGISS